MLSEASEGLHVVESGGPPRSAVTGPPREEDERNEAADPRGLSEAERLRALNFGTWKRTQRTTFGGRRRGGFRQLPAQVYRRRRQPRLSFIAP